MATLIVMSLVWGVITLVFAVLVVYRRTLTSHETDWIALTDDAKEEAAIKAQTIIEAKTRKLTFPIRALGTLSVVLLVAIAGFWLYHGVFTPPPMP